MGDIQNEVVTVVNSGRHAQLADTLRLWMSNGAASEAEIAWAFGFCFEQGIDEVVQLAPEFIHLFPNSLFPVSVFFADLQARRGAFDSASHEARVFLRKLVLSGVASKLSGEGIIADSAGRAIILLTAVYTHVGARSYSLRVLKRGLEMNLTPSWKMALDREASHILNELKSSPSNSAIDEKWERFFDTGVGLEEIRRTCVSSGADLLLLRMQCIERTLAFDRAFVMDGKELFSMIYQDSSGNLRLG